MAHLETETGVQSTVGFRDFEIVAASSASYDRGELLAAFRGGNIALASALFHRDDSVEMAAAADQAVERWAQPVEDLGLALARSIKAQGGEVSQLG